MFDMQMPWWEFILRAALVYLALMIMLRVSGKRTISEYTPFDLLVVVLIGESFAGSLAGSDESLPGGLLLAATLLGMNVLVAYIASRSIKAEKIIEGSPVLLGRNGVVRRRSEEAENRQQRAEKCFAGSRLRTRRYGVRDSRSEWRHCNQDEKGRLARTRPQERLPPSAHVTFAV